MDLRKKKKSLVKDQSAVTQIFAMLITIGIAIGVIFVIYGVVIPSVGDSVDDADQITYNKTVIYSESVVAYRDSKQALDYTQLVNSTVVVTNGSAYLTASCDFSVNPTNGSINFFWTNYTKPSGTYYITYGYLVRSDWYSMNDNMSDNVLSWVGSVNLVVIIALLALVIMAVAGMMVYSNRGGRGGM